ncbi:hypothetical protein CHS0354_012487 [Potamilus streckersoni]|uniref:Uncharacterized protein n=1 Tax=Potamilus streckersoni TaxID=2493646 RepID=A0AAE0S0F2_9BIVA|nr:hypothetical protein CHS0354_012487 [Potamilus streckersoni]
MEFCPKCTNKYVNPKILPCLDTVCLACLEEIASQSKSQGQFKCPACAGEIRIPEGGVSEFPTNTHVVGSQILSSFTEIPPCEICEEKLQAEKRCIECEQNFCSGCSKSHLKLKLAKDHTLISLTDPEGQRHLTTTAYCDKHRTEEMSFFCRTCLIPVCIRCRLTTHENHTTEELIEYANQTRAELLVLLDSGKNFRFSILSEIEEMHSYKEILSKKENVIDDTVSTRRAHFHDMVDRICDDMSKKLKSEVELERGRIENDRKDMETYLEGLSTRLTTATQILECGANIEVVRLKNYILLTLMQLKKTSPLSLSGARLDITFSHQDDAEQSLRYLLGRLNMEVLPPHYIQVVHIVTFRVENSSSVVNSICTTTDGKAWLACGWKPDIYLFDAHGRKFKTRRVGRDVDYIAMDTDGNAYVSCRDEHSVKRFDKNFKRRMATMSIKYPRGIACTRDCRLVVCVVTSPTYFDYNPSHENVVLKFGPDGEETGQTNNPLHFYKYPIRVAVNANGDLCVSDNVMRQVLIVRDQKIEKVYMPTSKQDDVAIVKSATASARSLPVTSEFFLTALRDEEDGTPSRSISRKSTAMTHSSRKSTKGSGRNAGVRSKEVYTRNLYEYEDDMFTSSSTKTATPRNTTFERSKAIEGGSTSTLISPMKLEFQTTDVDLIERVRKTNETPAFDPRGITCDRYGHIIVSDYSNHSVHMLDKHGRFLCYLVTEADGIIGPTSVAVDSNGLLWVGGGDATQPGYFL